MIFVVLLLAHLEFKENKLCIETYISKGQLPVVKLSGDIDDYADYEDTTLSNLEIKQFIALSDSIELSEAIDYQSTFTLKGFTRHITAT